MSEITLSAGVRSNLLSLQNTAQLMAQTQNRLATGKKVNSALDNPTNFFTASSLHTRSNDLSSLLDSMSNGIKTLEAADNGLKAITKTVETMQATLRQARQDKSFQTSSLELGLGGNLTGNEELTLSGGAVGAATAIGLTNEVAGATAASITGDSFSAVDFTNQTAATFTAGAYSSLDLETGTAATHTGNGFGNVDFTGNAATIEGVGAAVDMANFDGTTRAFQLNYGGNSYTIAVDTDSGDIADLVSDVQAAIDAQIGAGLIEVGNNGNQLTLTEEVATGEALSITAGLDNVLFSFDGTETDTGDAASVTFDLDIDGDVVQISLDAFTEVGGVAAWADFADATAVEVAAAINEQVNDALGTVGVNYVTEDNGELVFTSQTTGADSSIEIDNVTVTDPAAAGIDLGIADGDSASGAAEIAFTLTIDGDAVTVTLDADTVDADDLSNVSSAELAAAINAQANDDLGTTDIDYVTVNANGNLVFTSATTGLDSSLEITGLEVSGGATGTGLANQAQVDGTQGDDGEISFTISFDGGNDVNVSVDFAAVDGVVGNNEAVTAQELASLINTQINTALTTTDIDYVTVNDAGNLVFASQTEGSDSSISITDFAVENGATGSGIADGDAEGADVAYEAKSVDALVNEINNQFGDSVRASNDGGRLRLQNMSTQTLSIDGATSSGVIDGTSENAASISGNTVRAGLVDQFNELRDQLDKLADDASFNGINLLLGDNLRLTFNETGTSTIDIQVEGGNAINSAYLGVATATGADFDSDATLDEMIADLKNGLDTLRSQASAFGSNLSVVQNREEFTKLMMNTLQTGADNLILADTNEEGANMLALQTRQQLSSVALSLASQADQNVLRLF